MFRQLQIGKTSLPITQSGIDKMIRDACRISGLPKRVNQHLLRKIWISTAINLGVPEIVYKILSFKTVPQELLTYYLDRNELKEYWNKVVEALPLEPKTNGNGRVTNLQESLDLVMKVLRKMIELEAHLFESRKVTASRIAPLTDKQVIEEYVREEDNERRRIQTRSVKTVG